MTSNKLNFLFIQLPVLSHDFKYNMSHCPYASYMLCAYLKNCCEHVNVVRLPYNIETFGSDSLILEYILNYHPDVVCFSVYLWNIERSLYIASKIKEKIKDITVIFGGPEITVDNHYVLKNINCIDIAVVGQGEETLLKIAKNLLKKKYNIKNELHKLILLNRENTLFLKGIDVDVSKLISPYILGIGHSSYNGSILLETVRGCAYSCSYCYYHKNFKRLYIRDTESIIKELKWARSNNINDISFIDPSFLKRKDIYNFLDAISLISKESNYKIFCELNAEDVDVKIAKLLKDAKVYGTEIGIQSININTLRNISRKFNKQKFIQGINLLKEQDIEILLDFIVGLPGDRMQDVTEGIYFAVKNDLFDQLGVYPLSMLPGTELKEKKDIFGISCQDEPPYLVTKSKDMSFSDIKSCFHIVEKETDIDLFPREFPIINWESINLHEHAYNILYEIVLDEIGIDVSDFFKTYLNRMGNSILINIKSHKWIERFDVFYKFYQEILFKNPYLLVDIVIDEEILTRYSFFKLIGNFRKIITPRPYYIDRIYCDTIDVCRSSQLFLLIYKDLKSKTIVSIPSDFVHDKNNHSIFWFNILSDENLDLEDFFIDKFSLLTKIEEFSFRISYSSGSKTEKLPFKSLSLKI